MKKKERRKLITTLAQIKNMTTADADKLFSNMGSRKKRELIQRYDLLKKDNHESN